jgi:Ni/Fe-hydrogenase subunit HybB-like protein
MQWVLQRFWTVVFGLVLAAGAVATVIRFGWGLGASTNLSDAFPWGLWIGFDILCGVGLAAGGFVVAAATYVFNRPEYKPILRSAILTAFLGYVLVVSALMFDLGRPWYIWHAIIMWNPHSVMFEVAWCVMLYTTVLFLEFSPMVLEPLKMVRLQQILHRVTIPLVIVGIILSSLHQSSLGSLYLIVPTKVYPLWYSSNLPYFFFLSAVAVGPAMVTIESFLSSRAFDRPMEIHLLARLARISAVSLAVYLVLKIEDVIGNHLWSLLFTANFETVLYWCEILFGVLTPLVMLLKPSIRYSRTGLFVASLFVVLGFVLNRMNVSVTAMVRSSGVHYFPTWIEIAVSLMMVAIGFAAFRLAVKYLAVFPKETSASTAA